MAFFVENGRAIGYVHPYTIQKFWKTTLLYQFHRAASARSSEINEHKFD